MGDGKYRERCLNAGTGQTGVFHSGFAPNVHHANAGENPRGRRQKMSALQPRHWQLLAALADGAPQHVFALSKMLGLKPQQINGLWQQMPPHIRGLLRQHDGQWRLVRPLAVFDETRVQQIAAAHGFQTALLNECPPSND